jgi:putative transposase
LAKKKDGASRLSVPEKRAMIEPNHKQLSISKQCDLIGLPRSIFYREAHAAIETKENLALMRLIDEEFMRHPFLGTRKMRNYLRREGYRINRKRVQRLMRKMGLASLAPNPNTSLRNKEHRVYPYLLRNLIIDKVNQVWCTDITYIRLKGGFVYLIAVMDWRSRKVLSWEVSNTMDSNFCVSALERAIRLYGKPDIFNTDQGSQFTSEAFTDVLKDNNIKISMDGKGRWMDNVFIERLWRSVKYENVYLNEYASVSDLRQGVNKYFQYYNYERTHQSLENMTPAEIYNADMKKAA